MPFRRAVDHGPAVKTRLYFIMLSLAAADRHGLAIAREVEALSEGAVRLWPASLYGSLEDLVEKGWIEELDDPGERPPHQSERKRFYRLTAAGHRVAAAETERLAALVKVARSRVQQGQPLARRGPQVQPEARRGPQVKPRAGETA